jgi:hypothetical protein
MTVRTALTLRLLGPLIEVVCLILLLKIRDQGKQFAGIPLEYLLYAGLALGFCLVAAGLIFSSRPAPRRPRDPG